MALGVSWSRGAMLVLLTLALAGCRAAVQTESASIAPSASEASSPMVVPSLATSNVPSPTPGPADFTVSWTRLPWSGRVFGISYDSELGIWMAFGSEEMWTSTDGTTWDRHTFLGEQLGEGCPDPQPARMVDATRMAGRLWAAGTWDNDCDVLGLLMWSSTDGATWEIVPQGQLNYSVTQGVASNGSVLAVASHFYPVGHGIVRTSRDGRAWTDHQPGGPAGMLGIYGDHDGFVAVGYGEAGGTNNQVIWFSADGADWVDVSPKPAVGELRSVVREPGGAYVAAGLGESGAVAVWRSETGRDWMRMTLDLPSVASGGVWPPVRLTASGAGLGLVIKTAAGWQFSASINGVAWSPVVSMPESADTSFGPYAAMSGDQIIVFPGVEPESGGANYVLIGRLEPVV